MKHLAIAFFVLVGVGNPQVPVENGATGSPASSTGRPGDPRLVLSEVENLKLDNLKLKRQLNQCQVGFSQQSLNLEIGAYQESVLKAHGNPKYALDPGTLDFVPVKEEKK